MCFSGLQRRRRENFGVLSSLNGISTCFLKEILDFFTFGHQNFYIRSKKLHSEAKISGLNVKNLPSECKKKALSGNPLFLTDFEQCLVRYR